MFQRHHIAFDPADISGNIHKKILLIIHLHINPVNNIPENIIFFILHKDILNLVLICILKNRKKNGMKCAEADRKMTASHQPVESAAHLPCSCPGKCYNKNITRSHASFFNEPLCSPGNHKCFSRTGARKHEHRTPIMFNCFFLGRIYLHASNFSMAA